MAKEYYSSPEEVIRYTGIQPGDIGIQLVDGDGYESEEEKLKAVLENWLEQTKDLIDQHRNRDYHKEVEDGERDKIPPGIHHIALRIAANMVAVANMRRQTPIVKIDDFQVDMVEDKVFTKNIRRDLKLYPRKTTPQTFGMFVVNTDPEDNEEG